MKVEAAGHLCAYQQIEQHPNPSAHVIGATYQVIKPLKKDTSRIANNTSNKRIYALSTNIELSFKQRIQGITSLFSLPYNDCNLQSNQGQSNNKNMLRCMNEMFINFDNQAHKYKSTHSAYCNLTESDVMSIIQRLVNNFQEIFHHLSSCFLKEQEKIITNNQKNIFDIGKQFDFLTDKLRQQEKKTQKLQYKLKKLVSMLNEKQERNDFTSQIFEEMEKKGIHVEQWIFQSNVFKKIVEQRGFIRSEGAQIPIINYEYQDQLQNLSKRDADSQQQINKQTAMKNLQS